MPRKKQRLCFHEIAFDYGRAIADTTVIMPTVTAGHAGNSDCTDFATGFSPSPVSIMTYSFIGPTPRPRTPLAPMATAMLPRPRTKPRLGATSHVHPSFRYRKRWKA